MTSRAEAATGAATLGGELRLRARRRAATSERRIAGVAMLAAAPILLVGPALHPPHEFGLSADLYAAASQSPDLWYVSHAMTLAALALAAPGMLALARILAASRPVLGRWAALLLAVGLLGAGADAGVTLVVWEGANSGGDEAARALFAKLRESAAVQAPIEGLVALLTIGAALLMAGLYRERLAPRWALPATGAGLSLALGLSMSRPLATLGGVLLFFGIGRLGLLLAREP